MSFAECIRFLFYDGSAGATRRRRLGAGTGLSLFIGGFLAAVGLSEVVVAFFALMCLVVVGGVAVLAAPRAVSALRTLDVRRRSDSLVSGARVSARTLTRGARVAARTLTGGTRLVAGGVTAGTLLAARAVTRGARVAAGRLRGSTNAARAGLRSRLHALTVPAGGETLVPRAPTAAEAREEAQRLNASGVQLRRSGRHIDAAGQHRAALTILRGLDDRAAIALTLNNLALALGHAGDDAAAIDLFDEAATILRELGHGQHEGQVIANLGFVHRRYGRSDEAADVLQLALTKLTPSSNAYRTIEAELARAS